MATLAEVLALLPDNTSGDISAADMRQVVTDIWGRTDGTDPIEGLLFDVTAPTPDHAPGSVHWNADSNCLDIDAEFDGVTLQVGLEQWITVRNNSGATIVNGRPVRITGATGNRPTIALDNGQGLIAGVTTHDIPNNSFGLITSFGLVRDFNTSAFSDGARVYSSATGTLTTSPTGSFVGTILLAHITTGSLLTRPTSLDQIDGTTAARPTARPTGFMYFDTTLGQPVWWSGAAWVDALGDPA